MTEPKKDGRQDNSTELILRLNLPMHTAEIKRIDTDAAGKYLLTCSKDKTAKLWEVATGTLLQTYRPPIGMENEGILYACALSPDGGLAAFGGWTRNDDIYLFETSTGRLRYRISGLGNVIFDLAFSPDGRLLAAGLGGGEGIRVYRTRTFSLVASDSDYGDACYKVAFSRTGQLATVSYNGYIRWYNQSFLLKKKKQATGGKQPYGLTFSSDGQQLAVGYDDSPTIQVLDANTLEVAYQADVMEISKGLRALAFSKKSQTLLAGGDGFYSKLLNGQWGRHIRVWKQLGKGSYQDIPAADSTILDLKPLPDGRVVFGSTRPDWGIIDPEKGERTYYQAAPINKYASFDLTHFRLSQAGFEVGVKPTGKEAITFFVDNRVLRKSASVQPTYTDQKGNLKITDWQNQYAPKLNDQVLSFLSSYERNRSVDIAPDDPRLLFGADWNLYSLDANGKIRWKTPTQAIAWCVKIAGNGQVAAGGFSDGTIRWYRMSDGQLLLTLFLHADDQRWILWTPSGYYDAAAGAESMLGWHVNQGEDREALFYPISHFRDRYYRPDVIDRILETYDEDEAVRLANAASTWRSPGTQTRKIALELPPSVRIESPATGSAVQSDQVQITYTVESPNQEAITGLKILVDSRPVSVDRSVQPIGMRGTATVAIPRADCVVSVIAENQHGASEPASVHLKWAGAQVEDLSRPKLYILAIGVAKYEKPEYQLGFPAKDAHDFCDSLLRQQGRLYRDIETRLLTDDKATKDNILDGLDWLQTATTSRDVAMLFFAGHGIDDNAANFYFLPVGADLQRLKRTGLLKTEIQATVASIPGKVVVFMDACQSGGLMKTLGRRGTPDITRIVNELISAENGAIVFSSSTGRQYSLENANWGNGAFTKALVEGINGKANYYENGKITLKTLDAYISDRVKELTDGRQSPTTNFPPDVEDFPIAVRE